MRDEFYSQLFTRSFSTLSVCDGIKIEVKKEHIKYISVFFFKEEDDCYELCKLIWKIKRMNGIRNGKELSVKISLVSDGWTKKRRTFILKWLYK